MPVVKRTFGTIGAVLLVVTAGYLDGSQNHSSAAGEEYNPVVDPRDFSPEVTNTYFSLKPGTKFAYVNQRVGLDERIEIEVTHETREVMGVTTIVVRDRVWKKGNLVEDTFDWFAQHKNGDVWYFGEDVANYREGRIMNREGSWEAGIDGAKPGIIMLSAPEPGVSYRQEYYRRRAEDMGTVVAVGKSVTVPHGSYDDCVEIKDWTAIAYGSEHKYYCAGVNFLTLEESMLERAELVSVSGE